MIDNKNLILAVVLSIAILVGFDFFFGTTLIPQQDAQQESGQTVLQTGESGVAVPQPNAPASVSAPGGVPMAGGAAAAVNEAADRATILTQSARVAIKTPRLSGSIALTGARLDDLTMLDYREELEDGSPNITLLSPKGAKGAYFVESGWAPSGDVKVPTFDTVWKADAKVLEPGHPVTLSWDNGEGLLFKSIFAIDENYLFTMTQTVGNSGDKPVTLFPYGLMSRHETPEVSGFYILHEGLIGVFDGTLEEVDYSDLKDLEAEKGRGNANMKHSTTGGWLGITDKYWLMALVPDQKTKVDTRFGYFRDGETDKYQVDFLGGEMTVKPGTTATMENHVFAGAKEVNLLDSYGEQLGVVNFDLAIDFGWFYFLTKPIFYLLIWLNSHVGNFGIAIMILTVIIKLLFFPLANKSYKAMAKMKLLQPQMTKLREQYGSDKQRMNQEVMALYKREKANPASGCLPMVIQIPVFFSLYKVIYVTIEMRHAPFFGWIQDLSAPDPTSLFNLFGLIPWSPPDFLMIGVWPLIMGITMFLQQKLNPQPADPVQAKIFAFLPLMFTFLLARFSAGLVVYWAWNNVLTIAQQWMIMRRAGVK